MKAYYAKQDAEKLSGKGDTSQKLTLMKTSADSLKKSADALNDSSLWEKKKIKKKDEKTGEEIEVEDYDWDKITKAVKSFVEDYNDVVKEAGESNTKDVLRNASWMTGMTDKNSNMLAKIGITIGTEAYKHKSEIISDERAFYTNEKMEMTGLCDKFLSDEIDKDSFYDGLKGYLNHYYENRYELRNQLGSVREKSNDMLDKLQHMFGV